MSHYAVAVFCDEPYARSFDALMEPYDEQNEKYFVFEPMSEDYLSDAWENFHAQNPSWEHSAWLLAMFHYQDGKWGYWYNPNAMYDYYTLDGKSYLYEPTKEAAEKAGDDYPPFWKKSQIDWFAMPETDDDEEEHDEAFWGRRWDQYTREGDGFYSEKYYYQRFGTKKQFVEEMMRPQTPYAFVTPDGVWHAPGKVGWFACSDETAETQNAYWEEWCDFIKNAPDCYVSILDCHI